MTIFAGSAAAGSTAASSSAAAAAAASAAAASAGAAAATTAAGWTFGSAAAASAAAASSATAAGVGAATSAGWLSSLLMGSAASSFSAATGGLVGFGGQLTTAGLLQGSLGLFSAASSVGAGRQQSAMANAQGDLSDFQARQEQLSGTIQQNQIQKAMLQDLATQNAAWGTAGIDVTSGSAQTLASTTVEDAQENLGIARANAYSRAQARRIAASLSRSEANSATLTSYAKGAGSLLDMSSRYLRRG